MTKNAGKPCDKAGFTIFSILLSEILAISDTKIPSVSIAIAIGWPWKFPPEIQAPFSPGKINGLSVTELISVSTVCFTYSKAILEAPWTCGVHLKE